MQELSASPAPAPPEIYITDELELRPEAARDYRAEKDALLDLAGRLATHPEEILPRFVDLAMQAMEGIAAGLSILEPEQNIFRWKHVRGVLATFEDATTPRNFSPCGVTLDQRRPVLTRHSERFYDWIAATDVVLPEVLLVPLHVGDDVQLGTLWIVSDEAGHFHRGHARMASELASFVGTALKLTQSSRQLESALAQQEMLGHEMSHRIQNLFAVAEAIVRTTARNTGSKEEMTRVLVGRFHALSSAHGLIRRSFSAEAAEAPTPDLEELLRAIVKPHETGSATGERFTLEGPAIQCRSSAVQGIALIFHELATNAAKYGALANDSGRVSVAWREEEGALHVRWSEHGGPAVAEAPGTGGFGSRLLSDMVTRQLGGTLDHEWHPQGLRVEIVLPLAQVSAESA